MPDKDIAEKSTSKAEKSTPTMSVAAAMRERDERHAARKKTLRKVVAVLVVIGLLGTIYYVLPKEFRLEYSPETGAMRTTFTVAGLSIGPTREDNDISTWVAATLETPPEETWVIIRGYRRDFLSTATDYKQSELYPHANALLREIHAMPADEHLFELEDYQKTVAILNGAPGAPKDLEAKVRTMTKFVQAGTAAQSKLGTP